MGLKSGFEIKIVFIDGVLDIFKVMSSGEVNVIVELILNMVGLVFDVLIVLKKDGI